MPDYVFFFLYGMLATTGPFLSLFWIDKAARRLMVVDGRWRHDRAFWLAICFAASSTGVTFIYVARAVGNIIKGPSAHLQGIEGISIAVGLSFALMGVVILTWLMDLERERPIYLKCMGALTVVWAAFCYWLA